MNTVTHLISYSMVFIFPIKKSIIITLGSLKWHLLTVKSILRGASSFHITYMFDEYWTRIGFQTIKYVTNHARNSASKIRFSLKKRARSTACQCQSAHTVHHSTPSVQEQEEKHTFDWRETII